MLSETFSNLSISSKVIFAFIFSSVINFLFCYIVFTPSGANVGSMLMELAVMVVSSLIIGVILSRYLSGLVQKLFQKISTCRLNEKIEKVNSSSNELLIFLDQFSKMLEEQKIMCSVCRNHANEISGCLESLQVIGGGLTDTAIVISSQINDISGSTNEVSTNLNTISTSSEELKLSITEISKNIHQASQITEEARGKANSASTVVKKLEDSSKEIGNIIKVINTIAEQTNLLALNATIEAARAGEQGKGFAVVANEVKELAKESAKATEDISGIVKAIQMDSNSAINVNTDIINITNQINDSTLTISNAVEEQTSSVSEVNRYITEASKEASSIADIIQNLTYAVTEFSEMATQVNISTGDIHNLSSALEKNIIA
jgi:methyl-accepting chemotaxis protein